MNTARVAALLRELADELAGAAARVQPAPDNVSELDIQRAKRAAIAAGLIVR